MQKLILVFNVYYDPTELAPLIEEEDYYCRNQFHYFSKFDMKTILQTGIIDRFLTDKWLGRLQLNNSILDFSSGY
jgi:hypothetical protein